MEYDGAENDLDELLHGSEELGEFLQEVAEQGADRWATRSKWRTGFNATHVMAYIEPGADGIQEGVVDAYGYYAIYRENGGWNRPEHVLRDFINDIEG